MKTLLTIFFSITILVGLAQQTHRVNNNTGITGTRVYSTFAAAHTAAAANDIIIIEPSNTSYGDILLTKPLKIYGNGYFLNSTQKADIRNSTLGTVEFNTGSGGSEMYGVSTGTVNIFGVSNITLSRNNLVSVRVYNQNKASTTNISITDIRINRNYIHNFGEASTAGFTISNVLVNNNIIVYVAGMTERCVSWIIQNNTFLAQAATGTVTLANSVVENNLFIGPANFTFLNVTFSYNISSGTTNMNGINGNKSNHDIITDPPWLGGSNDAAYQIKPGDPLKTMGNTGIEVGAFGGYSSNSTPYILSGIPAIPSVVSMVNTGTGDNTNPVKATITVKSNN